MSSSSGGGGGRLPLRAARDGGAGGAAGVEAGAVGGSSSGAANKPPSAGRSTIFLTSASGCRSPLADSTSRLRRAKGEKVASVRLGARPGGGDGGLDVVTFRQRCPLAPGDPDGDGLAWPHVVGASHHLPVPRSEGDRVTSRHHREGAHRVQLLREPVDALVPFGDP